LLANGDQIQLDAQFDVLRISSCPVTRGSAAPTSVAATAATRTMTLAALRDLFGERTALLEMRDGDERSDTTRVSGGVASRP
jgi:hypothetical protein